MELRGRRDHFRLKWGSGELRISIGIEDRVAPSRGSEKGRYQRQE